VTPVIFFQYNFLGADEKDKRLISLFAYWLCACLHTK